MTARDILILLSVKNKGNWEDIFLDIRTKASISDEAVQEVLEKLEVAGVKTITLIDDNYPELLRHTYKPPFVLFYTGDGKLLSSLYDSTGILGKELIVDTMVSKGYVVALAGKDMVELKSSTSCVFVSTAFGADMTSTELARLFVNLSGKIVMDNPTDRRLNLLVMLYANKLGIPVISTPNEWVKDVAEDGVYFVDSFVDWL